MRKAGTLATTAAVALGMSLSMASFSSFAGGHCPVKAVTDGPKLNWKLSLGVSAAPSLKAWSTSPNISKPARAETSR